MQILGTFYSYTLFIDTRGVINVINHKSCLLLVYMPATCAFHFTTIVTVSTATPDNTLPADRRWLSAAFCRRFATVAHWWLSVAFCRWWTTDGPPSGHRRRPIDGLPPLA